MEHWLIQATGGVIKSNSRDANSNRARRIRAWPKGIENINW